MKLIFGGGRIALEVGDEAVESWDEDQVDFHRGEGGCRISANGEDLGFTPHQAQAFNAYLDSVETTVEVTPLVATIDYPSRQSTEPTVEDVVSTPNGTDAIRSLFDSSNREPVGLAGAFDAPEEADLDEVDQKPGLLVEEPDEYFSAGLNGPPGEVAPTRFRSVFAAQPQAAAPSPEDAPEPEHVADPEQSKAVADATAVEEVPQPELLEPELDTIEPGPEPVQAEAAPQEVETVRASDTVGTPVSPSDLPAPLSTASKEPPPDLASRSPVDDTAEEPPTRAGLLARFKEAAASEGTVVTDDDDTPQALDESENLRQWTLLAAGAVVLLVVLAMVAWLVASLMGGDEASTATATPPVATTAPSPPTTVPPTTAPPTLEASVESQAMAAAFVANWNSVAEQYAYHLSIGGDSLPISVAAAPTVQLGYDESGTLTLTMAPRGTGSDHDLLLAMGLAVAWADPGISPEGRKDLLSVLGVDVDSPQVADMGGEVSRNGVSYSLTQNDPVLRFVVTR